MGLPAHLIPVLVCLLACSSNFIHGRNFNIPLQETIKTLNILMGKNMTEKETFCRVAVVLRQVYMHHNCEETNRSLRKLDRNLNGMANKITCSVNEVRMSTLRDFLERLRRMMQQKYARG
ncbi:interleukin 4 [Phyllostomus discolor]|uniref:Interleukin-4 n=1 Tax=Phyllostomus discolor TaxID=89673 RepID=A0A833YYJ8_9CHIR|nr:interleukin 4 [Phyllostomus discolor]